MDQEQTYEPPLEVKRLKKQLREAKHDRAERERIKNALITIYVRFGESYKMNDQPNDKLAEVFLKKALALKPVHGIANYRLAHLLFKKEDYATAIYHFQIALDHGRLNETQQMITNMFMTTAGIYIAKQASKQYSSMELDLDVDYELEKIEHFRKQLEVPTETMLKRIYYRKVTPDGSKLISEETYEETFDGAVEDTNQVLLVRNEDGYAIRYGCETVSLETTAFHFLYYVMIASDYVTNDQLIRKLNQYELEQDYKPNTVRRTFSRMQSRIPFWDQVVETETIDRKTGRKRKRGITYCILCRASDVLPDEMM
ncbi:tetratricopeptide repeat protein [Aquibacillus sediminis]|uniref:tetratricopeptide repeat protein n=1 Tax=Aquibacillus sediminis TaxID=2574734 RepID=UPI001109F7EE|nr:hypothetical protein [Aquibacillus sediminis]